MTTYTRTFAVKRRCRRCRFMRPTTGGRLVKMANGVKAWRCAECRRKSA